MSNQNEIIQDFLVESLENLEELDQELVRLEKEPTCAESLSSVFRTIHTIKGTSSFLGFSNLERLTHKGESLLSRVRDGKLTLSEERTNALLDMVDAIREMLDAVAANESDGKNEYSELSETLLRLQEDGVVTSRRETAPEFAAVPNDKTEDDSHVSCSSEATHRNVSEPPADSRSAAAAGTLRIDVQLLDRIMDLVGELVLVRNQIILRSDTEHHQDTAAKYQRLNHITSDLQESVVKTRMQPIGRVWKTVPRQARDVAAECRKQVRVELDGESTELDKSIIEAIRGPITHIVRNCIDHGLESPEERMAGNKSAEGTVRLTARHESGQVVIEVSDDGRGVDFHRIREKALQRRLVTPEAAEQMTERQWLDFLFEPGFSTAATVTSISGRGVGLDVVKTNIERLAGTIELKSSAGKGTTFIIRIPLTLAIIPALVIAEGGSCYAIPQTNLTELVRLTPEAVLEKTEQIYGNRVFRLRGDLLPLIRLSRVFGFGDDQNDEPRTGMNIVVLDTGDRRFGLVVDDIRDTQEIVIKPLGRALRGLPIYSGATILGDGQVALILDVGGIASHAGLKGSIQKRKPISRECDSDDSQQDTASWLVVKCGERQKIINMKDVVRLEEIPGSSIERSCGKPVCQYRGEILSLVSGPHGSEHNALTDRNTVHVVVSTDGTGNVGYVVDRILDIVPASGETTGSRQSLVVGGQVSDIITVPELMGAI